MTFDPSNFDPNEHGGGSNELMPVGEYVMWCRSFKRKHKNSKDQIMFIIDPIIRGGKKIPKDSFQPIFETVTLTADAAWRLADLANAVGRHTPFNAMSDREIADVFRFKPFKASVKHETYQGKTGAKIDKYGKMNEEDEANADALLEDRAVSQATSGGYDEHDPSGSYVDNDGTGGEFNDDDIPF